MIEVKKLSVKYGQFPIVDDVSFTVGENKWVMLVGPNGAGKSTIVSAISQGTKYDGDVIIGGINTKKMKANQIARNIGILSQYHYVSYAFKVSEVVRLGRYAYNSGLLGGSDVDSERAVAEAIELTGLSDLKNNSVLNLSGGELQRVFLAQIFAQDPKILILDEPTNHLDLVYQKQIFELISHWIKSPGRAVISVVHDLNLAKAYGDEAILLNHGKIVCKGQIDQVLNRENLNKVYSMDVYDWMNKMLSQWNMD